MKAATRTVTLPNGATYSTRSAKRYAILNLSALGAGEWLRTDSLSAARKYLDGCDKGAGFILVDTRK